MSTNYPDSWMVVAAVAVEVINLCILNGLVVHESRNRRESGIN
jgi:hypothetical protein